MRHQKMLQEWRSPIEKKSASCYRFIIKVKARELNRLKRANSHLALGVFYAQEGMAAEAEKEFQIPIVIDQA